MHLARTFPAALQQAAALQDTVVTRMVPHRDLFDWTSGILQIVVLLLGIVLLGVTIALLLSLRTAVQRTDATIARLSEEVKPLVGRANAIMDDAREVVALVRTDVERLTDAASAVSAQLLDVAETTGKRVDEINAVIDVLQAELEDAAIGTAAVVRGVRVAAAAAGEGILRGALAGDDPQDDPQTDVLADSGAADDEVIDEATPA